MQKNNFSTILRKVFQNSNPERISINCNSQMSSWLCKIEQKSTFLGNQNYFFLTQTLIFVFHRQRMALPCMYDQCKHMLYVSSELNRLQVSYEEYLCMKTLLLLSSGWQNTYSLLINSHLSIQKRKIQKSRNKGLFVYKALMTIPSLLFPASQVPQIFINVKFQKGTASDTKINKTDRHHGEMERYMNHMAGRRRSLLIWNIYSLLPPCNL